MHRYVRWVAWAIVLAAAPAVGRAQGITPTPTVQVRVVDEQGDPIDAGRAVIDTLNRWALIDRGMATITDLPRGTWTVSLRVLGFRPESLSIEALTRPTTPVVTLHRLARNLAPVEVTAALTSKDSAKLQGIERRMRTAHGTLILGDNLAVRNASRAADALGVATGFRRKSSTVFEARGRCRSFPKMDSLPRLGEKVVAIYLDGTRMPGGLDMLNRMVPPSDILAIEAYPDVISAPFLWRTRDACAVVAFWTKRPPTVVIR